MSIEIIIDPNVRVAGNRTYAGFEDVRGGFVEDLGPGDSVVVLEEEADVIGEATVYAIDRDKHLIYLEVDWSSLRARPEGFSELFTAASLIRSRLTYASDANLGQDLTSTASDIGFYATAV